MQSSQASGVAAWAAPARSRPDHPRAMQLGGASPLPTPAGLAFAHSSNPWIPCPVLSALRCFGGTPSKEPPQELLLQQGRALSSRRPGSKGGQSGIGARRGAVLEEFSDQDAGTGLALRLLQDTDTSSRDSRGAVWTKAGRRRGWRGQTWGPLCQRTGGALGFQRLGRADWGLGQCPRKGFFRTAWWPRGPAAARSVWRQRPGRGSSRSARPTSLNHPSAPTQSLAALGVYSFRHLLQAWRGRGRGDREPDEVRVWQSGLGAATVSSAERHGHVRPALEGGPAVGEPLAGLQIRGHVLDTQGLGAGGG